MGDVVGEEIDILHKLFAAAEDSIVYGILSEDTQHDENWVPRCLLLLFMEIKTLNFDGCDGCYLWLSP